MTLHRFSTALLVVAALAVSACREPTPSPSLTPMGPSAPPSLPSPLPPVPTSPTQTAPLSTETTQVMALRGEFPPGPELTIFMGKCAICHSTSYIAQQRLTKAQWEKTIKKMQGWGAPVTDDEIGTLTAYFSTHFSVELPPPTLAVVVAPTGATSEAVP